MIDLIGQIKTVDMIMKGLRGNLRGMTPYGFEPEKKKYSPRPERYPLPRSIPEAQGVSSGYLERFFKELDQCKKIKVHSVAVLRHGTMIAQAHWKPYTGSYPHMMYSLSKSVTAMAVGMCIEEGLFGLDDKLVDLLPEKCPALRSPRINSVTVRMLLNMTAGVRFNEVGTMTERDWARAFLASDCAFEPGGDFMYNSLNSYMLSALVCKVTGMSLTEFLNPRLFRPLGIQEPYWEKCPMGIEKGGWGLYLRPEAMAKLGQLYLQKGAWSMDGKKWQLVPAHWVEESTTALVETKMGEHTTGYGFHLWSFPIKGSYQFNGVFGQYVVVIPDADMVLAITSGSQNLFIDDSAPIISRYFGEEAELYDLPLPVNVDALRSLRKTMDSLTLFPETRPAKRELSGFERLRQRFFPGPKPELPPAAKELDGKTYHLENEFGTLLPFILGGERNNFDDPISQVSFAFGPDSCEVAFVHGEQRSTIRAGLDGVPCRGAVTVQGETYAVGASALLTRDEDGHKVLKLYISFIETPNTRIIKFIFDEDRVLARFDESPSVEAAGQLLLSLIGGNSSSLEKMLMESIDQQKLMDHVKRILVPKARGRLEE